MKDMYEFLKKVNKLEESISKLSDENLRNKTNEFKEKIKNGEKKESFIAEAYAVVREATKRVTGKRLYDVQIMAGYVLNQGRIAEVKAGEGKTLIATLPVYFNAFSGEGVHVITVNEYLAKRDYEEVGKILTFLGISVGLIFQGMKIEDRKKAYSLDVTYGCNTEFGFDYLRDNIAKEEKEIVQRELNYAIVDEADSVLLDEANTPMIISNRSKKIDVELYNKVDKFVKELEYLTVVKEEVKNNKQYEALKEYDYYLDERNKNVNLTEKGIKKVEKKFNLDNLFDSKNVEFLSIVTQSLRANGLLKKDIDYIIQDGRVKIIDKFTGRIMDKKRYTEGLHEAIEAKEKLKIGNGSETLAIISTQNYFKSYKKLSGMTGTAIASNKEFQEVYSLDVVKIPTNRPVVRKDMQDRIFVSENKKLEAVVKEIINGQEKKQPILVGTSSVQSSEKLCRMLDKININYELLNAKNNEREAEIVKHAGEAGKVTISTNMAGRGTNILITDENVIKYGGLKVIGTERFHSSRIDEQLRGRSGRQGQVGESVFFLSLDDELIRVYGNEKKIEKYKKRYDNEIDDENFRKEFTKAQKKTENLDYSYRKYMVQFDDIMNINRKIIYKDRLEVLKAKEGFIFKKFLKYFCKKITNSDDIYAKNILLSFSEQDIDKLEEKILKTYEEKKKEVGEKKFNKIEKMVQLKVIDENWVEYIKEMDIVLDNISLKAYGGYDPIEKYAVICNEAFNNLNERIKTNIITKILFGVNYEECIYE